ITVREHMGGSSYFTATRIEPLLPMDIVESRWLLLPPDKYHLYYILDCTLSY
ncbi:uncharacterized protein BT62DRAFT_913174, partial [Guyanagaster necrorhizus]